MVFPDSYPTSALRYARTPDGRMVLQQRWFVGGGGAYEWRTVNIAEVPVAVVDATV